MKTYTLTEVAELLEADVKTLRRWIELEAFDLEKQTSKYDKRIKWLSEDQTAQLAKAHGKLWPPRPKSPAQGTEAHGLTGAVNLLKERVDTLREDHVGHTMFNKTIQALEERIAKLEQAYTAQLQITTDALVALKELQDWKQAQESKGKPGRKPKSPAVGTPEYQAGLAAVDQGDD
jgi:hypothetical protein